MVAGDKQVGDKLRIRTSRQGRVHDGRGQAPLRRRRGLGYTSGLGAKGNPPRERPREQLRGDAQRGQDTAWGAQDGRLVKNTRPWRRRPSDTAATGSPRDEHR